MEYDDIINKELDNLDMFQLSKYINSQEYVGYFTDPAGREHYRLLSFISIKNDNTNFLDIGTLKGCSALAFSINPNNKVYSFDIVNHFDLNNENGISFIIDDVLKEKYKDLILSCGYILLDTMHDGIFEKRFYNYLIEINYKGCLLLDDIKLNNEMIDFWNFIDKEKYDITEWGHATGTGIVVFD